MTALLAPRDDNDNNDSWKRTWRSDHRPIVRLFKLLNAHLHFERLRDPLEDPDFGTSYAPIWNAVFQPSPGVQAAIDQTRRELGLQQEYHAVHVRARYASDKVQEHPEENAIRCLQQKVRSRYNDETIRMAPIFVAADSSSTVRDAMEYGTTLAQHVIVGRRNGTEPLHLDRGRVFLERSQDWRNHAPEAYYDTFVDLYLMAGVTCLAHGVGGYGSWATLMGGIDCVVEHHKNKC